MNNFLAISPQAAGFGVAVYSPAGDRLRSGIIRHSAYGFTQTKFRMMRDNWHVDFAVIEAFGHDSPSNNIDLAANQFSAHILIHSQQWNPTLMGAEFRRQFAERHHGRKFETQAEVDAVMMGKWILDILRSSGVEFPACYLHELALTTRRFPRRQDLRMLQGRRLSEVANA